MIVVCSKCKIRFDDEYRTTICPHGTFAANDGRNNFAHHPESYISLPTKERLAQRLHSLGLLDLERRARDGEFSDYESSHETPKIQLVFALASRGDAARRLAKEVKDGEWDDTKEEAEAWFNREGKGNMRRQHGG